MSERALWLAPALLLAAAGGWWWAQGAPPERASSPSSRGPEDLETAHDTHGGPPTALHVPTTGAGEAQDTPAAAPSSAPTTAAASPANDAARSSGSTSARPVHAANHAEGTRSSGPAETAPAPAEERDAPREPFTLDRTGIQSAVRSALPAVRECYDGWVKAGSTAEGALRVHLVIEEDPEDPSQAVVTSAEIADSELEHAALEGCLLNALSEPTFEPPENGGKVEVTYPFSFAPEPAADADKTQRAD